MAETLSYELPTYLARRQAARRRERLVQLVALAIAAAGIVGASQFVEPMNRIRTERQLVMDPDTIKGLPPLETLLAKTGTFRALAIDVAFIRLERLKEEGKFYELMQLASWICKLAPQFPSVWVYHAWNQAYNISVATYTAEERWKWVNNGIRLLRDEGIQYNPKSVTLYKELAWFYWHKIGDFLDDHHWNYKRELAVEMELVLGPPPAVISEQEVLDAFRQIVDAPRDLAVMLEQDPEVAELVGRLDELNLAADTGLLEFVARHLRSELSVKRYLKSQPGDEAPTLHARRVGLLSDPSNAEARERLLAALRSQALRVDYHMDLEWMLTLMEKYGPIDWRSPYAMCLYWASWGDITTAGQLNLNVNDSMNTARFIFFALDNMVKRGKIVLTPNFDKPNESFLELLPDARFIDHYHETVIGLSKMQFPYDPAVERGEPAGNYRVGHFNFLTYAVQQLYLQGDEQSLAKAKEYYAYLRRVNRSPDGSPKEMYLLPLEEFVLRDIRDAAVGFKSANMLINVLMYRSLWELALGDTGRSVGMTQMARQVYAYYMEDKREDRNPRRKLGTLPILRADAVDSFLRSPAVSLVHKTRLWLALEPRTRQIVWDRIEPVLAELCDRHEPPLELSKAFPEPPGMDEYRLNPERDDRQEDKSMSPGTKF
ncbi:MAG: hypothetical protein ACYSUI_06905 [Planctomycetota bacterium]|jgi:hypothetical protein